MLVQGLQLLDPEVSVLYWQNSALCRSYLIVNPDRNRGFNFAKNNSKDPNHSEVGTAEHVQGPEAKDVKCFPIPSTACGNY